MFSESTLIEAPPEAVWQVLADIGTISRWNPGVRDSGVIGEAARGLGARRRCDLGGKNYLMEEVVEWNEGRTLTMRITETNLPFQSADIRFELTQVSDGTRVSVSPDYQLKFGPLGQFLDLVFVKRTYRSGMRDLLLGLKRDVEAENSPAEGDPS